MTTQNNATNWVNITGATGSGKFVFQTSPTINQPNQVGETSGATIASGKVGEIFTTTLPIASAVSLSNSATTASLVVNLASLPGGDYEAWGNCYFTCTGTATSLVTRIITSSTFSASTLYLCSNYFPLVNAPTVVSLQCPSIKINNNSAISWGIYAAAQFSSGTVTACGTIYARRLR